MLLRALLCAACLLPPTMLMGATLPAIARWIGRTGEGVSWLGFFYGANIAGCGRRLPARRFLPPPHIRHGHGHVRRRGDQPRHRPSRPAPGGLDPRPRRGGAPRGEHQSRRSWCGRAGDLRGDCAVRPVRARCRSDLDPHPVADAWGNDLYLFDHPGGVPDRSRHRQQPRLGARPPRVAAPCPGRVSGACRIGDRLDRGDSRRLASVLAGQPVALDQPMVPLSARHRPLCLGPAAGNDPVGRKLPAGARGGGRPGSGSRPAGRWCLRREYRRGDRRRDPVQPGDRAGLRHAGRPALADRPEWRGRRRRVGGAEPPARGGGRGALVARLAARRGGGGSRPPGRRRIARAGGAGRPDRLRPLAADPRRDWYPLSSTSARG